MSEMWSGWRSVLAGACACLLALACGCASSPQAGPGPDATGPIQELHLLALPVVLNLDGRTGPDGFGVKVYAVSPDRPKPVSIAEGTLELIMYDGIISAADFSSATPLRTWRYSATELPTYKRQTSIGTGYEFTPAWGDTAPQSNKISVIARYLSPNGAPISSAPSIIAVVMK